VGDSLISDIQGGNNAGILTCWYNPNGIVNDKGLKIDYEITDLNQILDYL
jgi:FMN phosphatase YigB (HAD superfamily)